MGADERDRRGRRRDAPAALRRALRPRAARRAVLGPRARSSRAPTCAGARRRSACAALAERAGPAIVRCGRRVRAGGDARLLDVHDLGGRERAPDRSLSRCPPRVRRDRPAGPLPGVGAPARARRSCWRWRTSRAATASSSRRCDAGAEAMSEAVELGARCPHCGEPWLRPTNLPGRYRCVYCLHRFELVSVCPDCGEHSTIVRMASTAIVDLQRLRRQHAEGDMTRAARRPARRAVDPRGRLRAAGRAGRRRCSTPARG